MGKDAEAPNRTGPRPRDRAAVRAQAPGRLPVVDVARGLSISLVVLGHTALPAWLNGPLSTVRLPFLFFISGYLFNWDRYRQRPLRLVRQRARRLLIPYAAAGLLTFLFWLLVRRPVEAAARAVPWHRPLWGWLYGSSHADWMVFNLPLWYLPASFCGQLLFWVLLRAVSGRSPAVQAAAALGAGLIGVAIGQRVHLPWAADVALAAQPFFWAGWFLRQAARREWLKSPYALVAALAVWVLALALNGPVAVNTRAYGQPLWFYLGGWAACLVAVRLAGTLATWPFTRALFGYLGRHSMLVLGFHVGLVFPLLSLLLQAALGDPRVDLWGLYWLGGLAVTALLAGLVERFPRLAMLLEGVPAFPSGPRTRRSSARDGKAPHRVTA
ncbi:MAG TPA: acyltransferase [Thermaerobacter sp.]